ncbi:MAG: hypothetical protein PSN37_03355 [Alphaproteobacteria bacterium]|nr:hypothetical protein [Alphaproteobacteria bacterium]
MTKRMFLKFIAPLSYFFYLFLSIAYDVLRKQNKLTSVHRLFPIKIGSKLNIYKDIICVRPARPEGIRIESEQIDQKHIVHCYGHGGSGWTLAPGTTQEAVAILLKQLEGKWNYLKGADVTIIGAGIIGQFSAYYLSKLKEKNPGIIGKISIVADKLSDLASDHAGGLFEPVLIGHSGTEQQLLNSYAAYHDISLGNNPDFQDVDAELMPSFGYNSSQSTQQLVNLGLIPPVFKTKIKVENETHDVVLSQLFFMNVEHVRRELRNFISENNISVTPNVRVKNFSDIGDKLVFNCSGLGAKELANDDNVIPFTGHLITFQKQSQALLDVSNCLFVDPVQKENLEKSLNSAIHSISDHISGLGDSGEKTITSCRSILKNLTDNKPENDPDWSGIKRIQIFMKQSDRLDFIYSLSVLMLEAKKKEISVVYDNVLKAYEMSITKNLKRYMFGLIGNYPDKNTGKVYHGDAYAFPLLFGDLERESSGSYRYVDSSLAETTPVYVAGGTYIEGMNFPESENALQFSRILDRLRYVGFKS